MIKATEKLEKAYIRAARGVSSRRGVTQVSVAFQEDWFTLGDAVSAEAYERSCLKLISQFKSSEVALVHAGTIDGADAFMRERERPRKSELKKGTAVEVWPRREFERSGPTTRDRARAFVGSLERPPSNRDHKSEERHSRDAACEETPLRRVVSIFRN